MTPHDPATPNGEQLVASQTAWPNELPGGIPLTAGPRSLVLICADVEIGDEVLGTQSASSADRAPSAVEQPNGRMVQQCAR